MKFFFFFPYYSRKKKRRRTDVCRIYDGRWNNTHLLYRHRGMRAHFGMALVRQPRSALPGGCWCRRRHLSGTRQERKVGSLGGGGGRRLRRAKVGRGTGNGLGKGIQAAHAQEERQAWVSKTAIGKGEARGSWNQGKWQFVMFQLCSG